jgi:predicted ABC-type ATPase
MIGKDFDRKMLENSFSLGSNDALQLIDGGADERLAQILADYLRKCLLDEKKKFSFETVFSHASKLEIMREATAMGYKVYLYFVSTEDVKINKLRVLSRTAQGGHNVPVDKIESRYYRSLDLLFDAAQIAYQAFFFDNSVDGAEGRMFAHFKVVGGEKHWDSTDKKDIPNWFKKYYAAKVK